MLCYQIAVDPQDEPQSPQDTSFIGGVPRLPADLDVPRCGFCGAAESFFFQLAFPDDHAWGGQSLALFHCTTCATKTHSIPPMLTPPLKGTPIPQNFLQEYQVNFHVLIFRTADGVPCSAYQERVKFQRWTLLQTADTPSIASKVGGEPAWLLEDEAPGLYAGHTPMIFLFQLEEGRVFETLPGAPPQASPYTWPGRQPKPFYRLFNTNELYAFGTEQPAPPLVYLLTQRD